MEYNFSLFKSENEYSKQLLENFDLEQLGVPIYLLNYEFYQTYTQIRYFLQHLVSELRCALSVKYTLG